MDIILVMCIGILVGRFLVPQGMKKLNEQISMCCTWLLIFAMGVMLGEREGFLEDLSMLGVRSFLFFFNSYGAFYHNCVYFIKTLY